MEIVGLGGEAGSGKDTVAEYLEKDYGFHTVAFADNLKKLCMEVFGLTHDDCYDQKAKKEKFKHAIRILPGHIDAIIQYVQNVDGYVLKTDTICELYKFVPVKQYFETPRELLQFVGTEVLRETIDDEYHINSVVRFMNKHKPEKLAISDARFFNERSVIKNRWKGVNVLVDRPSVKKQQVGLAGHASENSLGNKEDYDYVIDNSSTLNYLECKVEEFVYKK